LTPETAEAVPRRSLAFNTVLKRGVNDNCVSTRKENRSGGQTTGATFESRISLANLGAQEFAVALDAYFSAAQQVSHGRDRFFCVLRAGTDCQDEIAKGKFRTLL